jgi:hypothetical protein
VRSPRQKMFRLRPCPFALPRTISPFRPKPLPPSPLPLLPSMSSLCCHSKRKESRKHATAMATLTSSCLLKEVMFILRVGVRVRVMFSDRGRYMQREDRSYTLFITVSILVVVEPDRNQYLSVSYTTNIETVINNV